MKNSTFTHSLFALGTTWWFEIFDDVSNDFITPILTSVENTIREFEKNYSRFLDDSYISKLSTEKKLLNPPYELVEILKASEHYYNLSDGIFNIAVGSKLESIGYDKDYSFKVKNADLKIKSFNEEIILFSEDIIEISSTTRIDLGGIGKGWLVDKIAKLLKDSDLKYFFINAGGDIYATSNYEKPITFALENPFDTSESIGTIELLNGGIASSSPNRRKWKDKSTGKIYHHIIDTSENEAENLRAAVYTQAKTTTEADVFSTVLFICPINKIESYAQKCTVEWLIVFEDGSFVKSKNYNAII